MLIGAVVDVNTESDPDFWITKVTLTVRILRIFPTSLLTSSGQMINLKLSKSSGSGNSVPHVFGRLSSFMSERRSESQVRESKRRAGRVASRHAPAACPNLS